MGVVRALRAQVLDLIMLVDNKEKINCFKSHIRFQKRE